MSNYEFPDIEMGAIYMGNDIEYLIQPMFYSGNIGKYDECLVIFEYYQNPDFKGYIWDKRFYGHITEKEFHQQFHLAIPKERVDMPISEEEC